MVRVNFVLHSTGYCMFDYCQSWRVSRR